MTVDRSKLEFYSADPVDKIVAIYSDTFTAIASSSGGTGKRTHTTINHPFGASLFLDMTWSQDGGVTWQPVNTAVPDLSTPTQPVFQTCEISCYSTSTQIAIVASNYTTSAKTIQYKLAAFWKD